MKNSVLIHAKNLYLHIPIFKPSERELGINPLKLVSGFYLNRSSREVKTPINNLSFTIHRGDRLGVIGQNGAGKSTLLRLLSGIYRKSSGILEVHGSVHGLYNVKLGMNSDATGIENIYLRGLQMGLSLNEIRDLIQPVVEFAEIGDAINDVFSVFSTGMQLRLAVAISTMIKPDILIMDEWIGSGDENFRKKINKRMNDLIDDSRGLVIATHSTHLLKSLCTHGMVLDNGKLSYFGPIADALHFYNEEIV